MGLQLDGRLKKDLQKFQIEESSADKVFVFLCWLASL